MKSSRNALEPGVALYILMNYGHLVRLVTMSSLLYRTNFTLSLGQFTHKYYLPVGAR